MRVLTCNIAVCVAMVVAPTLAAPRLVSSVAAPCTDDLGCSLLGKCVSGKCECRKGWKGSDCGAADLAPLNVSLGYQVSPTGDSPSPFREHNASPAHMYTTDRWRQTNSTCPPPHLDCACFLDTSLRASLHTVARCALLHCWQSLVPRNSDVHCGHHLPR
jgi:hypothetical protein